MSEFFWQLHVYQPCIFYYDYISCLVTCVYQLPFLFSLYYHYITCLVACVYQPPIFYFIIIITFHFLLRVYQPCIFYFHYITCLVMCVYQPPIFCYLSNFCLLLLYIYNYVWNAFYIAFVILVFPYYVP